MNLSNVLVELTLMVILFSLPQIDVTFDIDANGILHVSARDKVSGKENKITIKANSGLTEAEVQKMVRDAAAHAEDDKRARELAESRNAGDALLHTVRKTLAEHGDKLQGADREAIDSAIDGLERALGGSDREAIVAKTSALASAAQKLGEKLYARGQETGAPAADGNATDGKQKGPDDVVDADFREVHR